MTQGEDRLAAFEARLAAIRAQAESGFADRVRELDRAYEQWATDPTQGEAVRRLAHKFRGVANGRPKIRDAAGILEEQAAADCRSEVAAAALQALRDAVAEMGADGETSSSAPSTGETTAGSPARRRRVLAVDDDADIRRMMRLTLERLGGYETTVAGSRDQALASLDRPFDLILLDAMMPDVNGLELLRAVRASVTASSPVFILSAASPEELGWSWDSGDGPTGWWRKPLAPTVLLERVREVLAGE